MNTVFKPSTTSSPQKTPIELREEVPLILSGSSFDHIQFQLISLRPRRPPRTAPSLSSSISSLAGASNDSPRSSTADVNVSGQFIIGNKSFPSNTITLSSSQSLASASQTLLSSESLNEEGHDEMLQTKLTNNKNSLSPTYQLANKFRILTKSSDVRDMKFNSNMNSLF